MIKSFVLLTCVCLPCTAWAGDGDIHWQTVDTRHFKIHFPSHLIAIAQRAALICEDAYDELIPVLDHQPSRQIEVTITDFGDDANGSATAIPYPQLNLFLAPPRLDGNLGDHDEWLQLLIYHEFAHILQLDQVSGFPEFLNRVFGRIIVPNQNLPSFQLEGGAVWIESKFAGRGRIHSALFTGMLRAQALSGRLHGLDRMTHAPLEWPNENIWYLYGGHFVHWVTERYGPDWMVAVHRDIANDVVPFAINQATVSGTGQTIPVLYRRWQNSLTRRARETESRLRRQGLSPVTFHSLGGRDRRGLQTDRQGALYSLDQGQSLKSIIARTDAGDEDVVLRDKDIEDFHLCPNGHDILVTRRNLVGGTYRVDDLYRFDPRTDTFERITRGARVREIECSQDGRFAYAAQIHRGGTRLVRIALRTGHIDVLHTPEELGQVHHPTLSPKGDTLVFTQTGPDFGRDLVSFELKSRALRRLTHDAHLEITPRFHLDGTVLYAADLDGIFNLYRVHLDSLTVERLSRVTTGATHPALTPDGRTLYFRIITADGFDIASTPFSPEKHSRQVRLDKKLIRPTPPQLSPRSYEPGHYLWPISWSPTVGLSSGTDTSQILGLEVSAQDPLAHHAISGTLSTQADEKALSLALSYLYSRHVPTYVLSLAHQTNTIPNATFYNFELHPHRYQTIVGSAAISIPMSILGFSSQSSIRYALSVTEPTDSIEPVHHPLQRAPILAEGIHYASISGSFGLGSTERRYNAISTETGWQANVSLRLRRPELGGEVETAELFWNMTAFNSPWLRHVVALRLQGASGRGDENLAVIYGLGQPAERNVFFDALDELNMGSSFLRGYASNTAIGDRYILATTEYRLPIADLFIGVETVPIFFRRLQLSVFTDWAQARNSALSWTLESTYGSAGAELLMEGTMGWRVPLSIRLGWAKGFLDEGETQLYFFLGRWF